MQHTLLLTGFEPFGRWTVNPSWEIAQALDGESVGSLLVVARKIPVNWAQSWPILQRELQETRPRYLLMLGLAGRRAHISVEALACNSCDETPDNEGKTAPLCNITTSGPDTRRSTLPVREMTAAIERLGLPVVLSENAGRYLCNNTLYKALEWASASSDGPLTGFIHVPNLPGINPEVGGIALEDQIRAVRAAIETIGEQKTIDDSE